MLDKPDSLDPERDFASETGKAIAVAVTISTQVSSNRSIVMQTYLPRDAHISAFHETLDKLTKATDRQEAKLALEGLEKELAQHQKTRHNLVEDFLTIEVRAQAAFQSRGKRGDFKLSPAEEAQKGTAKTNIERYDTEIKRIEAEIAKARGVILDVD